MSKRIVPTYYADSNTTREYRMTYASINIMPIGNPWESLHDGSILTPRDLANWEITIPNYGCSCKRFYAEWKAANAPDFTSPEAFFAWGVNLHNAVNAKLGKLEITIDEAYSIWRKSDGLEVKADINERP
jgi:hypothetical protein